MTFNFRQCFVNQPATNRFWRILVRQKVKFCFYHTVHNYKASSLHIASSSVSSVYQMWNIYYMNTLQGFSSTYIIICFFRLPDVVLLEKILSHWPKLQGLSPRCINMCNFSLPKIVTLLWHCPRLYGFSWLCISMCDLCLPDVMKLVSHCLQPWGFLSVLSSYEASGQQTEQS